jgi:uncharacterized OsmC-like protein
MRGDASLVVVERLEDGTLEARARDVVVSVGRAGGGLRSVELLLAALGTCMLGTMLVFAENVGVELDGVRLELEPVLASAPERVAEVRMTMRIDGEIEPKRLASLRRVAEHCKVHSTLEHGPSLVLEVEHGA